MYGLHEDFLSKGQKPTGYHHNISTMFKLFFAFSPEKIEGKMNSAVGGQVLFGHVKHVTKSKNNMVFILDGCSFHYAHTWSKPGISIC